MTENRLLVRREVGDEGCAELRFVCGMEVGTVRGSGGTCIETRLTLGRAKEIIDMCRAFGVGFLHMDGDEASWSPDTAHASSSPLMGLQSSLFPETEVSVGGLGWT